MRSGPLVQEKNNSRNSVLPNAEKVQYLNKYTQELVAIRATPEKATVRQGRCQQYGGQRREIISVRGQSYVSRLPKY